MHHLLIVSVNGDPFADLGSLHAGGQCKYILELGKHLVRGGWKVDVFTTLNPGARPHDAITYGFDIFRFPLADGRPYESALTEADITALQAGMCRHAFHRSPRYDAILACYWQSALVSLSIRRAIHRPLVVSFCSLAWFKLRAVRSPELERRLTCEKSLACSADHVVATSRTERDVLVCIYGVAPSQLSVIPRGVDLSVFYSDD